LRLAFWHVQDLRQLPKGKHIAGRADLQNLFNNGARDSGKTALVVAIKKGARTLDCFDGQGAAELHRTYWLAALARHPRRSKERFLAGLASNLRPKAKLTTFHGELIYGRDAKCSALLLHAAFFSFADQFQWQTISRQSSINRLNKRNRR
jgi:hypothetical protein